MEAIGWRLLNGRNGVSTVAGRSIRYRVLMEPAGTNVFFLAEKPQRLIGNFPAMTMDSGGAVYDLDADTPINRYEAESQLAQPDSEDCAWRRISPWREEHRDLPKAAAARRPAFRSWQSKYRGLPQQL